MSVHTPAKSIAFSLINLSSFGRFFCSTNSLRALFVFLAKFNAMQLVFSDAQYWTDFLPLSFTRPMAEMRCGILTFAERWKKLLETEDCTYITEDFLQQKFQEPRKIQSLFLVPNFLPTPKVLEQIKNLQPGYALAYEDEVVAANIDLNNFSLGNIERVDDLSESVVFYKKHTDLFSFNREAIEYDFQLLTKNRQSQPLSSTNGLRGDSGKLFIEEGAVVEYAIINVEDGPVYIGKNAEVMEGSLIRGPLMLGESAKLNLGAKVYGPTTIGPHCKVGGEVNNIVIFGYSNKGHDGFVGNSVIGEWCNLGADTNSSNLKNNYAEVKLWSYKDKRFKSTGLQFCGLIMGDHSKTAINTQLNTGTVVGVAANVFKPGFPPNHVPNFSWGGHANDEKFKLEKAFEVAEKVMQRRKVDLTDEDRDTLTHIYHNY